MFKSEEIMRLDDFVAGLPEASYLRPILESARPSIVAAIANDFVVADWDARQLEATAADLRKRIALAKRELEDANRRLDEAVRAHAAVKAHTAKLADELDTLAHTATKLSK